MGGVRSHYFVLTPNGKRAYVSDRRSGMVIMLHPHDPATPPTKVMSGNGPEGCCLSADGKVFDVLNRYGGDMVASSVDSLTELDRAFTHGESVRIVALPRVK